jgi:ABC-type bacteriocin/lantibiotic exporter with double-glycine peptidase domain
LKRASLLWLAFALPGCGSADPATDPTTNIEASLSTGALVLHAPTVRQGEAQGCGLACLDSLLRFHGAALDAPGRERFSAERLEKEPIPAGELRDYLRGRGFTAVLVHGTLDHGHPRGLLGVLEEGLPAIVELDTPRAHHYALACGFDPERRLVIVMDPEEGLAGVGYDDFERLWSSADHLMLVAAPGDH